MCDHGAYVEVCAKCLWSLCSPRDMYLMCMCDHGDLQVCIQCVYVIMEIFRCVFNVYV